MICVLTAMSKGSWEGEASNTMSQHNLQNSESISKKYSEMIEKTIATN